MLMNKLLEVNNLTVYYGTVRALEKASFFVNLVEIVAMIGPNGAGKSTALKAVCGLVPAKEGSIQFQSKDIKGSSSDQLVKKGLSLVPEGRRIFSTMTVQENLEMGAFTISNKEKNLIKERLERVFKIFPILGERRKQKAGTLSSGEQQMLAIGRALMLEPKLLMLDEPSLGLSPNYIDIVFDKLQEINKAGTAILLVEQNASKALEICHRGYVFEIGTIAIEGNRESLIKDEKVKKILIGG
jgi:branched-chain amino acid transport system ATP-binding protein